MDPVLPATKSQSAGLILSRQKYCFPPSRRKANWTWNWSKTLSISLADISRHFDCYYLLKEIISKIHSVWVQHQEALFLLALPLLFKVGANFKLKGTLSLKFEQKNKEKKT